MVHLLLASSGLAALPHVLGRPVSGARLAFVGAAGEPFPDPHWVRRDRRYLAGLGFHLVELDVTRQVDPDCLNDMDAVFVAGGNTYYLLQQVRRSGVDAALVPFLQAGKLYVGSSAGAIIASPDIAVAAEPDQRSAAPHLPSTRGLGLVPFHVLPHAGVEERFLAHHQAVLRAHLDKPIVRITDDEAIHVRGGDTSLIWSPS